MYFLWGRHPLLIFKVRVRAGKRMHHSKNYSISVTIRMRYLHQVQISEQPPLQPYFRGYIFLVGCEKNCVVRPKNEAASILFPRANTELLLFSLHMHVCGCTNMIPAYSHSSTPPPHTPIPPPPPPPPHTHTYTVHKQLVFTLTNTSMAWSIYKYCQTCWCWWFRTRSWCWCFRTLYGRIEKGTEYTT